MQPRPLACDAFAARGGEGDVRLVHGGHQYAGRGQALSWEQKLTLAKINALFGSVLFASDDFSTYSEEQNRVFTLLCELNHATDMKVKVTSLSEKVHRLTISYHTGDHDHREDFIL